MSEPNTEIIKQLVALILDDSEQPLMCISNYTNISDIDPTDRDELTKAMCAAKVVKFLSEQRNTI